MPGRVHTRREFARFSSPTGKGQKGTLRVVFVETADDQGVRVAYAIGRQVGPAVTRNLIRRRLRAAMDELRPAPRPGLYLIKCARGTEKLTYDEITLHLQAALERATRH